MMDSNLETSLRQEMTFRHVYDETHSYFKQSRRNDRGIPLEPAKHLLLQRVPREDTETSVYTYPFEYLYVDDTELDLAAGGPSEDLTERKVDLWEVAEREESDMKSAMTPHAALHKSIKQMRRYLEADLLGKLAIFRTKNHQVKRQLQIDRMAKQMRIVFAALPMSQSRLINFLLLENLTKDLLCSYLEGLRAVHIRWPTYVEEQLSVDPGALLKRMNINHVKQFIATEPPVIRLPPVPKIDKVQPVLIMIPHCEGESSRRFKGFTDMLRAFVELKVMPPIRLPKQPSHETDPARSVQEFLCSEIKHIHLLRPKTPIFVLGWGTGASLAAPSISPSLGSARGFIALGMPLQGGHGRRGYCEDKLINALATPSLFVTGALSQRGTVAQFELLRSRLSVESRLLVLGGADHILRLTGRWKWKCGVTQSMVDRQIVMEIRRFLLDYISAGVKSSGASASASPPRTSPVPRHQAATSPAAQRSMPNSHFSHFPVSRAGAHPHRHFPQSFQQPAQQTAGQYPSRAGYQSGAGHRGRPMMQAGQRNSGQTVPVSHGMRGRSAYRRSGRRPMSVYRGNRERRVWNREAGGPMVGMQQHHRHHPYEAPGAHYRQTNTGRYFPDRHEQFHRGAMSHHHHNSQHHPPSNHGTRGHAQESQRGFNAGPVGREIDQSYDQETAAAIQSIT